MLDVGDGLRKLLHAQKFSEDASVELIIDDEQLGNIESLDWRDYLIAPQPIISKKLRDAIAPVTGASCQFIPAKFSNATVRHEFFALNPLSCIDRCLDPKKSDCKLNESGDIKIVNVAVPDIQFIEEQLDEPQRLLFQCDHPSMVLCSDVVKEAIESVDPSGIKLFPIQEWNSHVVFQMAKEARKQR